MAGNRDATGDAAGGFGADRGGRAVVYVALAAARRCAGRMGAIDGTAERVGGHAGAVPGDDAVGAPAAGCLGGSVVPGTGAGGALSGDAGVLDSSRDEQRGA